MSKCRDCGMQIDWVKQKGKWVPYTHGVKHWEVCQKVRVYAEKSSGWITGEHYYDSKCDCSTPPWEVCEHSFPEVIAAELADMSEIYEPPQLP